MTYKLSFDKRALKEWHKLGDTLRQQFKAKLIERLEDPHVLSDKLHGYKRFIKLNCDQRAIGLFMMSMTMKLELLCFQ